MKKLRFHQWMLILLIVVILMNGFLYIRLRNRWKLADDQLVIEQNLLNRPTKVYYVQDDHLISEVHFVKEQDENAYLEEIEGYLQGPSDVNYNYLSNIHITNIHEVLDTIYVNLNEGVMSDSHLSSSNARLYLMSLVNTILDAHQDDNKVVKFIIGDGSDNQKFYGIDFEKESFRYDPKLVVSKDEQIVEVLEDFISFTMSRSFDNAYSLLSENSKINISEEDFSELVAGYSSYHQYQLPYDYQMERSDFGYLVYVYYRNEDVEIWQLVEENKNIGVIFDQESYNNLIR